VLRGGGADYHDTQGGALDRRPYRDADEPLSEYRQSRRSFGINVLGTWSSKSRRPTAPSASR